MTLRILLATSLLIAGALIAIFGLSGLWDNETFQRLMAMVMPLVQIGAGIAAIVIALCILAHETRLTDWVKEKLG